MNSKKKLEIKVTQYNRVKINEVYENVPQSFTFYLEDNRANHGLNFRNSIVNRITKKFLALSLDFESKVNDFNRSQLLKNRTLKEGALSLQINGEYITRLTTKEGKVETSLSWYTKKSNVFKDTLLFLLSQKEIATQNNDGVELPTLEQEQKVALLKTLKGKVKKQMKKGLSQEEAIELVAKNCNLTIAEVKKQVNK